MAYINPPPYNEQVYSTAYLVTTQIERDTMQVRGKRKIDVPLIETLNRFGKALGLNMKSEADLTKFFGERLS